MKRTFSISGVASMLRLSSIALFVLFTVGSCTNADSDTADATKTATETDTVVSATPADTVKKEAEVIAYYFHTSYRCVSCKKIEAYSKEAIETGFERELAHGTLEFHSINIDEPENKHYIKDYELYTKSLVISDLVNGEQARWKNLADVWKLLRSKDDFVAYVQNEIRAHLEEH